MARYVVVIVCPEKLVFATAFQVSVTTTLRRFMEAAPVTGSGSIRVTVTVPLAVFKFELAKAARHC